MKGCMVFAITALFFTKHLCAMSQPEIEMHNIGVDRARAEEVTLVQSNKIEVKELSELLNNHAHLPKGTQVIWKTGNTMHYTVRSDNISRDVRTVTIWRNNRECCGKPTSIVVKKLTKWLKSPRHANLVQISPTVEKSSHCRRCERRCCGAFMLAALGGLGWMGYYLIHDKEVI